MQAFLKSTISDFQLRYKIGRAVSNATSTSKFEVGPADAEEVIVWLKDQPAMVIAAVRDRLSGTNPAQNYLSIRLLECLINAGSFSFHQMVAEDRDLRARLIKLAADRAEDDSSRKVRSAARHVVLEFSRMFADESALQPLATMAKEVEKQSGRQLLRAVMMEPRRIKWRMPEEKDFCLIAPRTPPRPPCTVCAATNRVDAENCRFCGEKLPPHPPPSADDEPIVSGKVIHADPAQGIPVATVKSPPKRDDEQEAHRPIQNEDQPDVLEESQVDPSNGEVDPDEEERKVTEMMEWDTEIKETAAPARATAPSHSALRKPTEDESDGTAEIRHESRKEKRASFEGVAEDDTHTTSEQPVEHSSGSREHSPPVSPPLSPEVATSPTFPATTVVEAAEHSEEDIAVPVEDSAVAEAQVAHVDRSSEGGSPEESNGESHLAAESS